MKTELKLQIEQAIQGVLDANCEDNLWEYYIYDNLVVKMASAAELVFDSCMDGQEFYKKEMA